MNGIQILVLHRTLFNVWLTHISNISVFPNILFVVVSWQFCSTKTIRQLCLCSFIKQKPLSLLKIHAPGQPKHFDNYLSRRFVPLPIIPLLSNVGTIIECLSVQIIQLLFQTILYVFSRWNWVFTTPIIISNSLVLFTTWIYWIITILFDYLGILEL